MKNSNDRKKTTLRVSETDERLITELRESLYMTTDHAAILYAVRHFRERNGKANNLQRENAILRNRLAKLKSKIANVQLAYIDLTMSVISNEEE